MKEVIICNLSAAVTSHKESAVINAFAELQQKYSDNRCLDLFKPCCPSIFSFWVNKASVITTSLQHRKIINQYKLGEINTIEFFRQLLGIFNFLQDKEIADLDDQKDFAHINYPREHLLSFQLQDEDIDEIWGDDKGEEEKTGLLDRRRYILALLELAWNEINEIADEDSYKFAQLVELSKEKSVYLISNTNELNVHKILCELRAKADKTGIKLEDKIDISCQDSDEPIKIAENIYLCLSYRYGGFKTAEDNKSAKAITTTPVLLEKVVTDIQEKGCNLDDITIISQYPKDLETAKTLGIAEEKCHAADAYFEPFKPEIEEENGARFSFST